MAAIDHKLPIHACAADVYAAITTPDGLDAWWTLKSEGRPDINSEYRFYFGPEYDWTGRVVSAVPDSLIGWEFTSAEPDWTGTLLSIELQEKGEWTWVSFRHSKWAETNDHFRISSYCWASYLRLLKRFVERGEVVEYSKRDDA